VIHSCSKYIGGHSDVIAGVVIGTNEDIRHIFNTEFLNISAVPDTFSSWLLLLGLRTLPVRMKQHEESTAKVIEFLESRSEVTEVIYPYHKSHSQNELAKNSTEKELPGF
jgi:cystathionine beta-lyase/cystathionine gamma-synthase